MPVDLNGDGQDEIVDYDPAFLAPQPANPIILWTQDGRAIEQVNYAGRVLRPHFRDLNGDGEIEMLVPYLRSDSLFVSVVSAKGQKKYEFFLIEGKPRQEPDGLIPWDPEIRDFYSLDLDGDGDRELVTLIVTFYARLPRGILVHSLPDGKPLATEIIGAAPSDAHFLGDVDDDGNVDLVFSTKAYNNGANAGGFSDERSYVIAFELQPQLRMKWARGMGENWSRTFIAYEDFDQDGGKEILAYTTSFSSAPARAELIEPRTGRAYRHLSLSQPFNFPLVVDLNRDVRPEIVTLGAEGEIWVLDGTLQVVRRRKVAADLKSIDRCPDVDGDGIGELLARTSDRLSLLGPDLRLKAVHEGDGEVSAMFPGVSAVARRGRGTPSYILSPEGDKTTALELVPNRFYWIYRYGPWAIGLLGLGLIAVIVATVHRQRQQHLLWQQVQALALDQGDRGFVLLNVRGCIEWINKTLCRLLHIPSHREFKHVRFKKVFSDVPELVAFLQGVLATNPPHHREEHLLIARNGQERTIQVSAEPFSLRGGGRPYWLVAVEDLTQKADLQHARTWARMAQRVAHDIKNPLTSILLTLQRLQVEYSTQAPELATSLDPFSARIEERVESLRRLTRNFLKFVDLETPDLALTDLNRFLEEVCPPIRRGLPPDICLELKQQDALPPVRLDQEQMASVLDNLITNAVNALPEGGTITFATQLAQGLRSSETGEPRDYVVLEVRDTGTGIPASVRMHLFDVGVTTTENGTGLGLAIVKKIVQDHSGHVEVESEPGVGSVFSIYLPARS